MASAKNERVLNLLICLLGTKQFVTAERIRTAVPGYAPDDGTTQSQEAFKRMFERDKADLRDLGVQIETGTKSVADTESGYRVSGRESKLPDIDLTPAESAAVGLATQLWQSAQLESAAQGALLKLKAAGLTVDTDALGPIQPHINATDPAFEQVLQAVQARIELSFAYRGANDLHSALRRVQPWGIVSWRGRWYVVGHDLDRNAQRSFRLNRVVGPISEISKAHAFERPSEINLHDAVAVETPRNDYEVTIRILRGRANGLRRIAEPTDGDVIVAKFSDPDQVASAVARYGADVEVLEPPEARAAVVSRLRALAGWAVASG